MTFLEKRKKIQVSLKNIEDNNVACSKVPCFHPPEKKIIDKSTF
jgi:hypothetical protein